MKFNARKGLAVILALVLVLCMMPAVVFADGFDNSTTVPDGEYSGKNVVFQWSGVSGKTSLEVEKVVVAEGKATAVLKTSSDSMTHFYYLGHTSEKSVEHEELYNPENGDVGEGVVAFSDCIVTVPVVIGSQTQFSMRSSKMKWLHYDYTLTIKSDEEIAEEEASIAAAAAVDEQIAAIGEVTLDSEEKITAARKAYDALTDDQKALVTKLETLTAAEAKLKELKDAQVAEETATEEPASNSIELTITNKTSMFKAVTASLETAEDGSRTLVFALSGTGYKNLFKGTYEEAKANGADKTKWIEGKENAAGKLEFRVPLDKDETFIPLVAISQSYVDKYEAGQNPIERGFFPRYAKVDADAKTLETGDYEFAKELTITNNVKMFKPSTATLTKVGGPNSNNYSSILDLVMGSDAYDKVYIGTKDEAAAAKEGVVAIDANRAFTLKLMWIETAGQPDTIVDLTKDTMVWSFHSVSKDAWYEREAILSESKGTLTFNEVQEQDEDAVVKVVSVKDKNGEAVHFTLGDVAKDNELTKPIAVKVNAKVENEESINIEWQKDITLPEGTTFPVTIEFEYKNKDQNFYMYHFDGKDWKVVGEGKGGKATVTFDSLSPTALVSVKNPNTGDASDLYVWAGAFVVFAAAAVVLAGRRRKEEK